MIDLYKIHPSDKERIASSILGGAKVHGNFLVSEDENFCYFEELFEDNLNPNPKVSKLIRIEILEKALAEKGLPSFVRNVGKFTVDMIECVADLKAAKKLEKSPSTHIPRLLKLLDDALTYEDWSAIDDFVAAWKNYKIKPRYVYYQGEDYPYSEPPDRGDTMRGQLGWIVADCIRQLQRDLGRIPFRSEILEYVTFHRPNSSMDAQELSRQLKDMKLSLLIPNQTKAAIEAAKNWDKDWDKDFHRKWDEPWPTNF